MIPPRDRTADCVSPAFVCPVKVGALLALALLAASAQASPTLEFANPPQEQPPAPSTSAATVTTLHGTVKNAATGEPLPRALVRLEGDASSGALTDGEGRFEIPGVPAGPQAIQVQKPGFRDTTNGESIGGMESLQRSAASDHNVQVVAGMPDLVFSMAPTNSIRGQIQLSTGDPAQNISVMLLRRAVQDGRAVWQIAGNSKTNSEGAYRFAGLADGAYAVYTDPAMDSDSATSLVESGNDSHVARFGYASTFYPDARDLAGAARIQLAGGQEAQANVSLTLEPFYLVRATVAQPGARLPAAAARTGGNYSVSVLDQQGHLLPYSARGDQAPGVFQMILPDGNYSVLANYIAPGSLIRLAGTRTSPTVSPNPPPMVGEADFSVAGHAITSLRVSLAPQVTNPLQVSLVSTGQTSNTERQAVFVTLSQAGGWITDGMVSTYAEGSVGGPLETNFMGPGSYWVHTSITQGGLCEASFTAGGASLAREPLLVGSSGATAPMTLTLRDDCASLKLSLPANAAVSVAGEEPFYTAYVVPDFDSTVDVTPVTLRPSSGGSFTLQGLTPGNYHVYTFAAPVDLEYRNAAALAALPAPGQAVSLAPGVAANLVVEVPAN